MDSKHQGVTDILNGDSTFIHTKRLTLQMLTALSTCHWGLFTTFISYWGPTSSTASLQCVHHRLGLFELCIETRENNQQTGIIPRNQIFKVWGGSWGTNLQAKLWIYQQEWRPQWSLWSLLPLPVPAASAGSTAHLPPSAHWSLVCSRHARRQRPNVLLEFTAERN